MIFTVKNLKLSQIMNSEFTQLLGLIQQDTNVLPILLLYNIFTIHRHEVDTYISFQYSSAVLFRLSLLMSL